MPYKSSSTAADVSPAPVGSRIIRAMQPSAARGETVECVENQSRRGAGGLITEAIVPAIKSDDRDPGRRTWATTDVEAARCRQSDGAPSPGSEVKAIVPAAATGRPRLAFLAAARRRAARLRRCESGRLLDGF